MKRSITAFVVGVTIASGGVAGWTAADGASTAYEHARQLAANAATVREEAAADLALAKERHPHDPILASKLSATSTRAAAVAGEASVLAGELKPAEEPPPTGEQTTWAPPSTAQVPLTDAQAAARVTHKPEIHADNTTFNNYVPAATELEAFHAKATGWPPVSITRYVDGLDGLSSPSTDDLIQWAAAKWGIPADWVRAQIAQESTWHQCLSETRGWGDRTTVSETDWNQYGTSCGGKIAGTKEAFVSDGLSSVKWIPSISEHPGTEPLRWKSTAFNLDYYAANIRAYFDGLCSWCGTGYSAGQDWASIGAWFSPTPWKTASEGYVASVQKRLAERDWTAPGF